MLKNARRTSLDDTFYRKRSYFFELLKSRATTPHSFRLLFCKRMVGQNGLFVFETESLLASGLGTVFRAFELLHLNTFPFFCVPGHIGTRRSTSFFTVLGTFLRKRSLSGYTLKNVKGGFLIHLEAFFCFVPNSLVDKYKVNKDAALRHSQLFLTKKRSLSLGVFKEVDLNCVFSRKPVSPLLKKFLKFFNFTSLQDATFFLRKKKVFLRKRSLRVFCKQTSQGAFLRSIKEVLGF